MHDEHICRQVVELILGVRIGEKFSPRVLRGQGAHQNKLETARNLLAEGVESQIVARCTGLPMETIHQLIQED